MTTEAFPPAWKPSGVPVTVTTMGKVATPELVVAIAPTEVTVPGAAAAVAVDRFVVLPPLVAPLVVPAPPVPPKPPKPPPPPKKKRPPPPTFDDELPDELDGVTVAVLP